MFRVKFKVGGNKREQADATLAKRNLARHDVQVSTIERVDHGASRFHVGMDTL
jgi:hypothetical protein